MASTSCIIIHPLTWPAAQQIVIYRYGGESADVSNPKMLRDVTGEKRKANVWGFKGECSLSVLWLVLHIAVHAYACYNIMLNVKSYIFRSKNTGCAFYHPTKSMCKNISGKNANIQYLSCHVAPVWPLWRTVMLKDAINLYRREMFLFIMKTYEGKRISSMRTQNTISTVNFMTSLLWRVVRADDCHSS